MPKWPLRLLLPMLALLSAGIHAEPVVLTLEAAADTTLRRGQPNASLGTSPLLELDNTGHNRILVGFDRAAIAAAVGDGELLSARLQLSHLASDQGSAQSAPIALHLMTRDWTEYGATWHCAGDWDTSDQKQQCEASGTWELKVDAQAPWGTEIAQQTLSNAAAGELVFDVTESLAAAPVGERVSWVIKKANNGQNGHFPFVSRESSLASGPRLLLEVAPKVAASWLQWDGSMGPSFIAAVGDAKHDSLKVAEDRVLWVGHGVIEWQNGLLRLLGTDREAHEVSLLAEIDLNTLLAPYGLANARYSWYQGRRLFLQNDGRVVLAFHDSYTNGLVWVTLDISGDRIVVPADAPPVALTGPEIFGGDGYGAYMSGLARMADGRYLVAFNQEFFDGALSTALAPWGTPSAGFSLSGSYVQTWDGTELIASATDPGRAEWKVHMVAGEVIEFDYTQTASDPGYSAPGVAFIEDATGLPLAVTEYRHRKEEYENNGVMQYENRHVYAFLAPVTGGVTIRMSAPASGSANIVYPSFYAQMPASVYLRTVDLRGAEPLLGERLVVPSDHQTGKYLGVATFDLTQLGATGRYLLSLGGTGDPNSGVERVMTRLVSETDSGLVLGPWQPVLSSDIGPDMYFSVAVNTDTYAEALVGSVGSETSNVAGDPDNRDDEPLVADLAIAADALTVTDARVIEYLDASYHKGIGYLGNNEYLMSDRVTPVHPVSGLDLDDEQHLYVFKTDGQGRRIEQSAPISFVSSEHHPSFVVLDDQHVLLSWTRGYDTLVSRILFRH